MRTNIRTDRLRVSPLLLPILCVIGSGAALAAPGNPAFAGSEACKRCHQEESSGFFRNPHFQSVASGKERAEKTGCEGCHGPGAGHVASFGKEGMRDFLRMSSAEVTATCLGCHARDLPGAVIQGSEHTRADVVCTNCHSIHHAAAPRHLLARAQAELCYECHRNVRSQFALPEHHRVDEGAMTCSDCHNPHGAFPAAWRMGSNDAMLEPAFDVDQPCLRCHVDKRGPFVFEHASVRVEGCTVCHFAHGSTNTRLLRRPVVFTLCLQCHNGQGTFGRETLGVYATPATHNLLDPRFQRCTLCHVRIHGSNSDPMFLR